MEHNISLFLETKKSLLLKLKECYPQEKSLVLDFNEFEEFNLELSGTLLENPQEIISELRKQVTELTDLDINIRFVNLPAVRRKKIKNITVDDICLFGSFQGFVIRKTQNKPKIKTAVFRCSCGNHNPVEQNLHEVNLVKPRACSRCGEHEFLLVKEECVFINSQKIEIQEPIEDMINEPQPYSFEVLFFDDLVDCISVGDSVLVNGIVLTRPESREKDSTQLGWFILANSVEVQNNRRDIVITVEDEKRIIALSKNKDVIDILAENFLGEFYGNYELKRAIMLSLVGGSEDNVNPLIHLLMVGDPGVAKTKLMQLVYDIGLCRVILSNGNQCTGPGLTAAVVKDGFSGDKPTLRAGALVLANNGILGIDELDKASKDGVSALLEAMENMYININKGGFIARFKARTTLIAAANPENSRFDPDKALTEQVKLPPTFISRCTLIFFISDVVDEKRDRALARHILTYKKKDTELPLKYLFYSKKYKPIITGEVSDLIENAYVSLRSKSERGRFATTARMIRNIKRLSEASAKLHLRDEVSVQDAEAAIKLSDFTLRQFELDSKGHFDTDRVMGIAKETRDKFTLVLNKISELCDDSPTKTIKESELKMHFTNISTSDFEKIIDSFHKDGRIFNPSYGVIGFVK